MAIIGPELNVTSNHVGYGPILMIKKVSYLQEGKLLLSLAKVDVVVFIT